MNSEKVKEIKELIDYDKKQNELNGIIVVNRQFLIEIITLINELESENERLQRDCADIANHYQEMGKFYYEETEKNQQLKNRIAELENTIKNNLQYTKGYGDGVKATVEVTFPKKLNEFAERLKQVFMKKDYVFSSKVIDETLKEFTNE